MDIITSWIEIYIDTDAAAALGGSAVMVALFWMVAVVVKSLNGGKHD